MEPLTDEQQAVADEIPDAPSIGMYAGCVSKDGEWDTVHLCKLYAGGTQISITDKAGITAKYILTENELDELIGLLQDVKAGK